MEGPPSYDAAINTPYGQPTSRPMPQPDSGMAYSKTGGDMGEGGPPPNMSYPGGYPPNAAPPYGPPSGAASGYTFSPNPASGGPPPPPPQYAGGMGYPTSSAGGPNTTIIVNHGGNCPNCGIGVLQGEVSPAGWILCVLTFFFLGCFAFLFLLMSQKKCSNCNYVEGC